MLGALSACHSKGIALGGLESWYFTYATAALLTLLQLYLLCALSARASRLGGAGESWYFTSAAAALRTLLQLYLLYFLTLRSLGVPCSRGIALGGLERVGFRKMLVVNYELS